MAIKRNTNVAQEKIDDIEYMQKLKNAPIEEFAKYLGGDLNLAVQLRIDEAVSNTYDKIAAKKGPIATDMYNKWAADQEKAAMKIFVHPINPQGSLLGFASINISGIKIDDFKILKNKNGELFIGMPSKPDETSKTGYRNIVHIEKEIREEFSEKVLDKYHEELDLITVNAGNTIYTPDKPSITEQMIEAEKQVTNNINTQPPSEKKSYKHVAGRE